mmetsp:Transcript_47349/g.95431  ORF Transcript_47349/g.95431 Transcript_47349/m.95431 type:complete len:478 (-) Transcript_47349:217-1650(-)
MSTRNSCYSLIWLSFFLRPFGLISQAALSRPRPQPEEVLAPIDADFAASVDALKRAGKQTPAASMESFSSSVKSLPPQKSSSDHPKMLTKLQYSVFDLAESEAEADCRSECIRRFLAAQDNIEEAVCEGIKATSRSAISEAFSGTDNGHAEKIESVSRGDGMTEESCAKGVDAGLYLGCRAWCDPNEAASHQGSQEGSQEAKASVRTTFRHDKIHSLANRTRTGLSLLRETCSEVQGRAVRIQLLEDKAKRQPLETAACEFGFRAGFASVVITEQRLGGMDKLNLPIAFWEHNVLDNQRRKRFFYWWGGTDTQLRAEEECQSLYRDEPAWLEFCVTHMKGRWEVEARAYFFAARDPASEFGDFPMRLHDLPLLYQTISSTPEPPPAELSSTGEREAGTAQGPPRGDGRVSKQHVVVRNMEQSAVEAALFFCSGAFVDTFGGYVREPYLSECREVMSRSLRIEREAQDLNELKRMRIY